MFEKKKKIFILKFIHNPFLAVIVFNNVAEAMLRFF